MKYNTYPIIEEVNTAERLEICRWHRLLRPPQKVAEVKILDRISERLKELGGFTPEISKQVGW